MADDRIQLNLVLNEASVASIEGRVRNIVNNLNNHPISLNIDGRNINNIINNLNTIYQQMQRLNNSSVNINANLTTQQQQYRLETERMRVAQQISVERERTLQTENRAIRALAEENRTMTINRNLTSDINGNIRHTHEHIRNVNNATNDFATGLGRSLQYILQYRIITEMLNQITEAYRELKAVDSSMVGYRKVTGASKSEVKSLTKDAFANASKYSRLASEYAESTERFAKAGYNDKSSKLSELALLAENVGDIDNNLANEFIVSSDAAWKLNGDIQELTNILDMFNELSNRTATDVEKLASGITVSGSMFAQAKLSAQDYAAIIGTATSKTQRSGEEMSRAWRTIIMNLSQIKGTDIETGEIIDEDKLAKAEKTLNAVGIQIREIVNGQNELRNPMNVLKEIADKWHSLSSIQQSALAESISNKRQSNAFISVIENWKDVEKAIEITSESSNSAIRENEIYMDSWPAKQKKVSAEWSEFISHMSNVEIIKGTLDALASAINVIDTPLGRIVTQIVLVNTALAVSNRLWGAVRSRSIVADILSIGLAEGSLGTAIQLVTGHLWEQAAAWLATPMGMATVTSAGIFLLASSISKYNEKLEESRQEMIEAGKEASKLTKDLDGLVEQYRKLGEDGKLDNSDREQAYDIQQQINELLGDEVDYINLANGKYEDQLELLKKLQYQKANDNWSDIKEAKKAAEESLVSNFDAEQGKWAVMDTSATSKRNVNIVDEIIDANPELKDFISTNVYEYKSDKKKSSSDKFTSSVSFRAQTDDAEETLLSYEKMVDLRKILEKSYKKEIDSGGALEDFYKNLCGQIDAMSESIEKYKEAMSDYNINQAVITFNETEFDVEGLGKIKGAFINSEEAMSGWITSMINAEDVSDGVQAELIALAQTWYPQYTKQINEAVEAEAKKVAQDAIADKSLAGNIQGLKNEASALGITEGAMIELVLAEIRFNKNNLNVSQKISALKELAVWAGVAQAKIDSIFSVTGKSSMQDKEVWAERNNVKINYGADKDGSHSYTYNGKTYSGVSEVNTILADEAIQKEIDKMGSVKVPSGGGVAGGGSKGSSSSSNEALDNYLKDAENRYKIHQDETKYINDLKWAHDNLTKSLDEQLDITGKINEAYRDLADNRIKDLEHQIDLTKELYGEDVDVTTQLSEIQKVAEEEANRLRAMGYDDNSNEIQDLQKTWWDAQNEKLDFYSKQHEIIIRDIEHARDMALETNPFADTTLYNKQLQDEYHKEAERLRAIDAEKYKEEIQELQRLWWDARNEMSEWRYDVSQRWIEDRNTYGDWELFGDSEVEAWERVVKWLRIEYPEDLDKIREAEASLFEARKKLVENLISELESKINDDFDIRISRLNSKSSLLSSHFGIVNAIAEEQHNLNKELREAETIGARMSELERETLFSKADHNKLSSKLSDIMVDITDLQSDYLRDLERATEDTIEEVTNQYERQYELKMKEYEIVRAELNLIKKQQILENTRNEKSVRTWNGSQWVYEANLQDVLAAQEEVENAKYELARAQAEEAQQTALNAIDASADALQTEKNILTSTIEDLSEKLNGSGEDIAYMLQTLAKTDLPTFEAIIKAFGDSIKENFDISDEDIGDYRTEGSIISKMKANSKAWHSSDATTKASLEAQNKAYANMLGLVPDPATGRWKKKDGTYAYASGTNNAHKGIGLFDEKGFGSELILTNDGVLTQFNGGERVFSPEMADRLWEMAQKNNILTASVPKLDFSKLVPIEERINNAISNISNISGDTYMIKDVQISESEASTFKGFINYLKKKV